MAAHGLEEVQGADKVIGVVLQGLCDALPHRLEAGKVNHRIDVRILGEEGLHLVLVAELRLDEGNPFAGNLLHPAHRLLAGIGKIVRYHNLVPCLDELHAGVAADVPSAAADQNGHNDPLLCNKIWNVFSMLYCSPTGGKWKETILPILSNIVRQFKIFCYFSGITGLQ